MNETIRQHRLHLALAIAFLAAMTGCFGEGWGGVQTDSGEQVRVDAETTSDASLIERLQLEIARLQAGLAQNQTEEQREETQAAIAALDAKIVELTESFAERTGVTVEQVEGVVSRVIAASMDPDATTGEKIGQGAQETSVLLPPPWNLVVYGIGTLLAGGYGVNRHKAAQKAREDGAAAAEKIIRGINDAIKEKRDGEIVLDSGKATVAHRNSGVLTLIERVKNGDRIEASDITGKAA